MGIAPRGIGGGGRCGFGYRLCCVSDQRILQIRSGLFSYIEFTLIPSTLMDGTTDADDAHCITFF